MIITVAQSAAVPAPGAFTPQELERLVATEWSLEVYLQWMGRMDAQRVLDGWWVGSLTRDLDHWAESGVRSAQDLADYLDACVERERYKDQMSGYDEDWDPELGLSDVCVQCGDLADFTATGAQLCEECHGSWSRDPRDDDDFWAADQDVYPAEGPGPDFSPRLDVLPCAVKFYALATQGGWLSPYG